MLLADLTAGARVIVYREIGEDISLVAPPGL